MLSLIVCKLLHNSVSAPIPLRARATPAVWEQLGNKTCERRPKIAFVRICKGKTGRSLES